MTRKDVVQEFMDAVYTASEEVAFAGAASRLGDALGFRWFTYLSVGGGKPEPLQVEASFIPDWTMAEPRLEGCKFGIDRRMRAHLPHPRRCYRTRRE